MATREECLLAAAKQLAWEIDQINAGTALDEPERAA